MQVTAVSNKVVGVKRENHYYGFWALTEAAAKDFLVKPLDFADEGYVGFSGKMVRLPNGLINIAFHKPFQLNNFIRVKALNSNEDSGEPNLVPALSHIEIFLQIERGEEKFELNVEELLEVLKTIKELGLSGALSAEEVIREITTIEKIKKTESESKLPGIPFKSYPIKIKDGLSIILCLNRHELGFGGIPANRILSVNGAVVELPVEKEMLREKPEKISRVSFSVCDGRSIPIMPDLLEDAINLADILEARFNELKE